MATNAKEMFFSIIIPTRDRPQLFKAALQSVLEQSFVNKEILVVIDGSTEANLEEYRRIEKQYNDIAFHFLLPREAGHGQSYSMNHGAYHSTGQYVCFLDDDDYWTDHTYLQNVFDRITTTDRNIDLHYSNQKAYHSDGTNQTEKVWLEDLIPKVQHFEKCGDDCYLVDRNFLLSSGGFAHINCSVFRREFFQSLSGMDESVRYENDRDIYIRSLDAADGILFSTNYMSRHNIPDSNKKDNMSTAASSLVKKLYQLRVYEKNIVLCQTPAVVKSCCRGKNYELKHVATIFAENKDYKKAAYYARMALLDSFNLRWLAYTLYLNFHALTKPNQKK